MQRVGTRSAKERTEPSAACPCLLAFSVLGLRDGRGKAVKQGKTEVTANLSLSKSPLPKCNLHLDFLITLTKYENNYRYSGQTFKSL